MGLIRRDPRPFMETLISARGYFGREDVDLSHSNHLTFQINDGAIAARFHGLRLQSHFQPIFDPCTLEVRAFEALLRSHTENGLSVSPPDVFALPKDAEEIKTMDRLCRAVHAANFGLQRTSEQSLFLNVDGRYILNVDQKAIGDMAHIILGAVGLSPEHVVLEVLESNVEDLGRLSEVVLAYQSCGFRVAIDDFGAHSSNFDRLWRLNPNIVKLDRGLLLNAGTNARARKIFPKIVDLIHDLDALVVCEGVETWDQHQMAVDAGVNLVQGYFYAHPMALLHAGPPLMGRPVIPCSDMPWNPVEPAAEAAKIGRSWSLRKSILKKSIWRKAPVGV